MGEANMQFALGDWDAAIASLASVRIRVVRVGEAA